MSVRVELHLQRQLDAPRGPPEKDRYGPILGNPHLARCVPFFSLRGCRRTDRYKSQYSNSTAALRLGVLRSTSQSLFSVCLWGLYQ